MFWIWVAVPLIFWPIWLVVSRGKPLRHLGTLHFVLYFMSIYAAAYSLYESLGSRNELFMISVLIYPLVTLLGVGFVLFWHGWRLPLVGGRVPQVPVSPRKKQIVRVVTCVLFGALIAYTVILGGRLPIITLLTEGSDAGRVARFVTTKGYTAAFGGIGPLVWISRILIDYFAFFLVVYQYGKWKIGHSTFVRFLIVFLVLASLTIAFNERYPLFKLLFCSALFIVLGIERPRVTLRAFVRGVLLFALAIPGIGVIHAWVNNGGVQAFVDMAETEQGVIGSVYTNGWAVFVNRAIEGQVTGLFYTYEIVPRYHDFFYGRTFSNPRHIFPYDNVNFPYLVADWHMPAEVDVQSSDPSAFFGEVYANFGFLGSLASMFLMGVIIQWGQARFAVALARDRSPYYLALYAMTMLYLADFALGFVTIYFDARFYLIVAMFLLPHLRWSTFQRPTASPELTVSA